MGDAGQISTPGSPGEAPASELATDAVQLLQRLIACDTVNPPGNELPAQEHLHALLSGAGFECELLGARPERPNLVARLRGAADGPTLCYLGHLDTVLAEPSEWRHDPWSGELAEGCVWGRGALDMKSQVAAEVAAAVSLARSGWRPARGDLLLVAVVDEETGGSLGAEWLTKTHPEKVRCDLLVNEGGGAVFEYRGRRLYGVCCAEKGVFRFTVTTEGVAGHASMPKIAENALVKMGPLLQRLAERQPAYTLTAEPAAFLRGIGEDPGDPAGAVANLLAADPRLASMFEPMLGVTFAPTRIRASEKINVIPSRAELKVDCRVPPGLGEEEVLRGIAEVLGPLAPDGSGGAVRAGEVGGSKTAPTPQVAGAPGGAERAGELGGDGKVGGAQEPGGASPAAGAPAFSIEFTERVTGNRSPAKSPLMDAISGWIAARDPDAEVVPVILPGFTDSRHFRDAFPECVAYGFFPQRHQSLLESMPLIHAADERIDVRDVAFAAEFFRDLARSVLE
ncbi:MAG TPA: M20/M25/M40 family metallo-hydrolase [Solirubrobacteraceae bacterium]|nr:M20/M25/M40 family metallo-hydrolase [Solirubrobacteraceae bacterium]